MYDEYLFDERAAIMEYDGGMSRAEAEIEARIILDMPSSSQFTLRSYQQEAVTATLAALEKGECPIINLATGSGKSLVIAALCAKLPGRILVVTHRKKLLSQNSSTLAKYLGMAEEIGVYSAGLNQRDTTQRIVFGGVQSIYKRMDELSRSGDFTHIIIDECHLVAAPGEDTMYTAVLGYDLDTKRIGLSATPSRMGKPCWGPTSWFTCVAYEAGIRQLTPQYLAPLVGIYSALDVDLSRVRIQAGEFVQADASQAMSEESVAKRAIEELRTLAQHRKKWAIFCCDIAHTRLVATLLTEHGITTGVLLSDQAGPENDKALQQFETGETRALVSCIMMTTGFDVPGIDCVVLLRPTMSKELLIQMLGRGTRQAEGKKDSLILDYAGNMDRHEPLEEIATWQKTPERERRDAETTAKREERERLAKHHESVLQEVETLNVTGMKYKILPSRRYPGTSTLLVTYVCTQRQVKVWLCPEYTGWARIQAEAWFARRGLQCPATTEMAETLARSGTPRPESICVGKSNGFDRVIMEYWEKT